VIDDVLRPTEEVRDALDSGRPVVALETSVLSHGLPADAAAQAAADMDAAVRTRGGVPRGSGPATAPFGSERGRRTLNG
jgi:pseudouridine-5'-phosphate glycosidase